jgi:hypothetical protein
VSVTVSAEGNVLLTYGINTEPSPLQTSISESRHTIGEIQFAVSNSSDVEIWCQSITFTVEPGPLAQNLFEPGTAGQIVCTASPSPEWGLTQAAPGTFIAQPSQPKYQKITTDGIFLDISQIVVNLQVGNVQLTVNELSSLDGIHYATTTSFQISKFPPGFFVRNFTTSSPQVPNGKKATLTWEGSQNAKYVILYNSEQPVDVTKTRAWSTPALTSDTTFILKASVTESGQTVETYLNLTVLVLNPNLVATSLQVLETSKLGTSSPTSGFPLSFPDALGDKISLWGQSGYHFGFGVQSALLQIHTDVVGCDIAFGTGNSSHFTETMRIKGTGKVGIGTPTPGFPLSFASNLGDKISLWGESGIHYGFGVQGALLQIHTDSADADIAFGSGSSAHFNESMRVKGNSSLLLGGAGSNGIMFSTAYAGYAPGKSTNHAEICNDISGYKSLMLVGNSSKGFGWSDRWVQVWDSLDVANDLYVGGVFHQQFKGTWWSLQTYYGYNNYAYWASDLRLKNDVQTVPSALSKVRRLRGVTFRWNDDALRYLTRDIDASVSAGPRATPEEHQEARRAEREKQYRELGQLKVGVLAQEVEAVFPEAVITDAEGYKLVNYDNLIPLLIEAVKEQDQRATDQQTEIDRLKLAVGTSGPAKK